MKKIISISFILLLGILSITAQISGSLSHGGLNRTYLVYLPTSYTPGSSLPVVFVLHALTQNGQRIMQVSGFNSVAETNNFIAVYPDGIGGTWNVNFTPLGGPDDVGFLDALADQMAAQYGADLNRLYSCGLSNGGFMSYKLACESSKCFAAVASVAGVITDAASATCTPTRSVPVMHIHGTADGIVAYNGAIGFKSVNDVLAYWLFSNNNCSGNPTITTLPNVAPFDLSTVDRFVWAPCDNGAEVQLLRVNNGGHQWPGTSTLLGGLGIINRDINASQEIWNFFNRFTCNQTAINPIPPAPTATAAPSIVCLGTTSTLTATSPGGTYEWFNTAIGGAPLATGATFTTPPLFFTTTYWVQTTVGADVSARTGVVVTVDPNPQPLAPVVTALPPALCGSGVATLASTLPVLGTINWYDAATGGNLLGTGALLTTPTLTATTTFWAEPVRGNCVGPRTAVTVAVNPVPAAPTATASPATVCQGTSSTLTASGSGGVYTWFDAPTAGILLWVGSSYTTLPLLNTTTFYVEETDANGCTSARTPVTVTVNPLPPAPSVTPATICAGTTATLNATAPGGTYEWFNLPIGGTALASGATFTTPVLNLTTIYWVQTTDANGCVSFRTPVTVTVTPTPPAPSVVARPAMVCSGNSSVLISRNLLGSVSWYDAPTGGNLLGTGRLYTTPALTATTAPVTLTYYAENTILGCTGPRAAVTVTVNPVPATPTVTTPISLCFGTAATLAPTAPQGGTFVWYATPAGGLPVWIGPSFTTPRLVANTRYFVETVANGCSSPRATVSILVTPPVQPPKLGVSPAVICAGTSTTLTATVPAGAVVDWYNSPFAAAPLATGLTFTTPALSVRTTYWASVTVNGCPSVRSAVTVYVNQSPAPLVAALPPLVCTGWTSTLTVGFPLGGTISWYDAPTGGNLLGTGLTYTTPPISATTTIYAESILNGCLSPQRTATTVALGPCKTDEPETVAMDNEKDFLNVFPNPSNGIFKINFSAAEPRNLSIFDAAGKVVYGKDYSQTDTRLFSENIDLSSMPSGLYFIRIMTNSGAMNTKLMLE